MKTYKKNEKREEWMRKRGSIVDQMRFMNISDSFESKMDSEEVHQNAGDLAEDE